MSEDFSLTARKGLPPHLRALIEAHPRETWNEGIGQVARFWLDRHLLFRRLMDEIRIGTQGAVEGKLAPEAYARLLSRYGSLLIGQLEEHHTVEDMHYFPRLAQREASMERGFKLLDADHVALDAFLHDFADKANLILKAQGAERASLTGDFNDYFLLFERLIDRHLLDEEDIVVPVLLKHGEEWLG